MKCFCCEFTSEHRSVLEHHERCHKQQVRRRAQSALACRVCLATFPLRTCLSEHMRSHRNPNDGKPCVRVLCPTTSSSSKSVILCLPLKGRPFSCHCCSNSFSDRRMLEAHMRRHTENRPFECELCPATFVKMSSLAMHQRSHEKQRGYKACDVCFASFKGKADLAMHMRTHRAEQPYKCSFCTSSYGHKGFLLRHLLLRHSDKKDEGAKPLPAMVDIKKRSNNTESVRTGDVKAMPGATDPVEVGTDTTEAGRIDSPEATDVGYVTRCPAVALDTRSAVMYVASTTTGSAEVPTVM